MWGQRAGQLPADVDRARRDGNRASRPPDRFPERTGRGCFLDKFTDPVGNERRGLAEGVSNLTARSPDPEGE